MGAITFVDLALNLSAHSGTVVRLAEVIFTVVTR
jgi:hypothetical protein